MSKACFENLFFHSRILRIQTLHIASWRCLFFNIRKEIVPYTLLKLLINESCYELLVQTHKTPSILQLDALIRSILQYTSLVIDYFD